MSFLFRPILSSKSLKTKNYWSEDDSGVVVEDDANSYASEGIDRCIIDFESNSIANKNDNISGTNGGSLDASFEKSNELKNSVKIDSAEDLSLKIDDLSVSDLNDLPGFSRHDLLSTPSAAASNSNNNAKIHLTDLNELQTSSEVEVDLQDIIDSNIEVQDETELKYRVAVTKAPAVEENSAPQDMYTSINSDFDLSTFEKIARPMEPARVPSWMEYFSGCIKIFKLRALQGTISSCLGYPVRVAYVGKLIFKILKKTLFSDARNMSVLVVGGLSITLLALSSLSGYSLTSLSQLPSTNPILQQHSKKIQGLFLDNRMPENINPEKHLENFPTQQTNGALDDLIVESNTLPSIVQESSDVKRSNPPKSAYLDYHQPSFIDIPQDKLEIDGGFVDSTISEPSPDLIFQSSHYEYVLVDDEEKSNYETWRTRFNIFVSVVLPFSFIVFLQFFTTFETSVSTANDNRRLGGIKGNPSNNNRKMKVKENKQVNNKNPAMKLHAKKYQSHERKVDSKLKTLNKMTVPALRDLCKKHQLNQGGPKDDLLRRLCEFEIDCFLVSLSKNLLSMSKCNLVLECKKRNIISSGNKGNLIDRVLTFERDLNSFPTRDISKYRQFSLFALKKMASDVGEKVTGNKDDLSYRILIARETRFCTSPHKDVRVALKQSGIECSGSHEECARRLAEAGLSLDE